MYTLDMSMAIDLWEGEVAVGQKLLGGREEFVLQTHVRDVWKSDGGLILNSSFCQSYGNP